MLIWCELVKEEMLLGFKFCKEWVTDTYSSIEVSSILTLCTSFCQFLHHYKIKYKTEWLAMKHVFKHLMSRVNKSIITN